MLLAARADADEQRGSVSRPTSSHHFHIFTPVKGFKFGFSLISRADGKQQHFGV